MIRENINRKSKNLQKCLLYKPWAHDNESSSTPRERKKYRFMMNIKLKTNKRKKYGNGMNEKYFASPFMNQGKEPITVAVALQENILKHKTTNFCIFHFQVNKLQRSQQFIIKKYKIFNRQHQSYLFSQWSLTTIIHNCINESKRWL